MFDSRSANVYVQGCALRVIIGSSKGQYNYTLFGCPAVKLCAKDQFFSSSTDKIKVTYHVAWALLEHSLDVHQMLHLFMGGWGGGLGTGLIK